MSPIQNGHLLRDSPFPVAPISEALGWMTTILDGIHEANPDAKVLCGYRHLPCSLVMLVMIQVVGFGYDTMFGGTGCTAIAKSVIPQCWTEKNWTSPIECFQTQQIRLQVRL
jgi:hypothetical protein